MRLVVYVPQRVPLAGLLLSQCVSYAVEHNGYELAGIARDPTAVRQMIARDEADRALVALPTHARHLRGVDVVRLPEDRRRRVAAFLGVAAAPLVWLYGRARDHPAATAATAAGLVTLPLLLGGPDDPGDQMQTPPEAAPPVSPPPRVDPTPEPSLTPTPTTPPTSRPPAPDADRPVSAPPTGDGGEAPAPPPESPGPPPAEPAPDAEPEPQPEPEPEPPVTTTPPEPTSPPMTPADGPDCLVNLDVDLLGIDLEVCIGVSGG